MAGLPQYISITVGYVFTHGLVSNQTEEPHGESNHVKDELFNHFATEAPNKGLDL